MNKRNSYCGSSGDGFIATKTSQFVTWVLDKLDIDLDEACENHDVNWEDGANTVDDIRFALDVYTIVRPKSALLAGLMAFVGFILVRITAIVYKHISKSYDK